MLVTLRGQGVKEVQTVNCYAHYTLLNRSFGKQVVSKGRGLGPSGVEISLQESAGLFHVYVKMHSVAHMCWYTEKFMYICTDVI